MNNSIKYNNLEEVKIQIKRSEVKKNILIKNLYKEYEFYFQIIRKSILKSVEKGIYGLYSNTSINEKELNLTELTNFFNENITSFINSKLPLITFEQLKLEDITDSTKQVIDVNTLKGLVESKEYQTLDFENEFITKEPLEFNCNNNNTYQYYETLNENKLSSVNLDQSNYPDSLSKQLNVIKIDEEKRFLDSFIELIEEPNESEFNSYEKTNDQLSDIFIPTDNLKIFESIDKSLNNLLLDLSFNINSELFKINIIKKIIKKDSFKFLANKNFLIKNPLPFVMRFYLNSDNLITDKIKSSNISLLNINNIELEFYYLDLSISRNNINQLKNQFRVLNKKKRYWKHKEHILTNLNS